MKKIQEFFKLLNNAGQFWTYLLVGIVFSVISVIGPKVSGDLVNSVIYQQEDMREKLLLLVAIHVLQVIFSVLDQYSSNLFQVNQKKKMRSHMFRAVIRETNLNREKISSFVSFMNNDVPDIVESYFQGSIDIVKCLCITLGSSIALLNIHWLLAVVIVGCSILVVALPNIRKEQVALRRKKYTEALEKYNTYLESFLERTDIIKAFQYQKNAEKKLLVENKNVVKQEQKVRNCQVCVYATTGFVQMMKTVLILTIGVYLIYIQNIKVGELLTAVQLAELIAAPVEVIAYLVNGRNETKPLLAQYKEIIEIPEQNGSVKVEKIERIRMKQLNYSVGGIKILQDVSFSLEAGKKYMVVGKSGSGKTTLLNFLGKIGEEGYTGEIFLNNTEYREIDTTSFFERVGVVTQEPYLFWMSFEENILMGRSVKKEDYQNIIEKLNLTYLLERFKNQPLDEETVSKLSGGEKQRISLARAMVGKPEVYLLDEADTDNLAQLLGEQEKDRFEKIVIPAGLYLVCVTERERYPVMQIEELRKKAVSEWLPSSGYQLTDAPEVAVLHWFYEEGNDAVNDSRYVELWLPIVKR